MNYLNFLKFWGDRKQAKQPRMSLEPTKLEGNHHIGTGNLLKRPQPLEYATKDDMVESSSCNPLSSESQELQPMEELSDNDLVRVNLPPIISSMHSEAKYLRSHSYKPLRSEYPQVLQRGDNSHLELPSNEGSSLPLSSESEVLQKGNKSGLPDISLHSADYLRSHSFKPLRSEYPQVLQRGDNSHLGLPSNEGSSLLHAWTEEAMTCEERMVQISIEKLMKELYELDQLSPAEYDSMLQMLPQNHIFKVHPQLRQVNPKAYEPQTISIGPYHHGKEHLEAMELHKKHCLNNILLRSNVSLDKYMEAMIKHEAKARRFYADSFNMDRSKFAEMMLLDGCFIVELIRLVPKNSYKEINDPDHGDKYLFKVKLDLPELAYDLLLVENQLPLFVLQDLFDISRMPNEDKSFIDKAVTFFCGAQVSKGDPSAVKHLLGLVYQQCVPSEESTKKAGNDSMHLPKLRTMRHVIALEEAGVTFKPKQSRNEEMSLFDIKFTNGTMEIPTLRIDDYTERILRNLMVYEQFIEGPKYVCDYAVFMDCLINTEKDAELLHHYEIIDNWLGDHEVVAKMFNSLCQHIRISSQSYYQKIYGDVDKHCQEPWNERMATLRHDYFNTPWALISFLAALLLLLITVAQFIQSFF